VITFETVCRETAKHTDVAAAIGKMLQGIAAMIQHGDVITPELLMERRNALVHSCLINTSSYNAAAAASDDGGIPLLLERADHSTVEDSLQAAFKVANQG